MTSLLAAQLNRLRVPENQAADPDRRRRKSLIHAPTEVGKIDAAEHLERAQKAFSHLLNVDPSLAEFRACLFSEERLSFEPSMQTPEQRSALNRIIEHFYLRVSQHLLLGLTLDALEWLVYRFETHQYNMEAMLQAVLPYHATNLFPRFLQLFDLTASSNRRWHWLSPLASQGLPLSRGELVKAAARDDAVLEFVCQLVQRAFNAFGAENEARLRLFVNLYAQVTLGVLMKPLDDTHLTKCVNCLNFYVLKGMRAKAACYRHAAYQIVQLLAVKHRLSGGVLHIWMKRLLKSSSKHDPSEVCLLLAILCKTQRCQVPDELAEKFVNLCRDCNSTVLTDFPEVVVFAASTSEAADKGNTADQSVDVDNAELQGGGMEVDGSEQVELGGEVSASATTSGGEYIKAGVDTDGAASKGGKPSPQKQLAEGSSDGGVSTKARRRQAHPSSAAETEAAVLQMLGATTTRESGVTVTAAEKPSQASTTSASPSSLPLPSPLLAVGCLLRLLASPTQVVRRDALACLRQLLAKARPRACGDAAGEGETGDDADGREQDESEADATVWDTVEAVLSDARAIERDQHWVRRQQLAPACARLVWQSMAELVEALLPAATAESVNKLTPVQRCFLLGHLAFLTEAQLADLIGGSGGDGTEGCVGGAELLLRLMGLQDERVAKAVAMKITPAVFNRLSAPHQLAYLIDGLGATSSLSTDADVLALATSSYAVATDVYLDGLADLFGLVPSCASIQNLSAKRRTLSQQGNAYVNMSEQSRRQARLLFHLASCDARTEPLDAGLQLVIRLLEVLQILVQAYTTDTQGSASQRHQLVSDINLCLVSADRAAARTPNAAARASGLADLIPLQAALDCARALEGDHNGDRDRNVDVDDSAAASLSQRRSCQYAAVGLLCRLCRLAPASAAACCRGLVAFLVGGGFFGRSDRHSGELWHGMVSSVLPAFARCNPSAVPLLAQLLPAYDDMPPSHRPGFFAQLVTAVGHRPHLWAMLLLLNRRWQQQQNQLPSHAASTDGKRSATTRRRKLSSTTATEEAEETATPAADAASPAAKKRRRRLSGSQSSSHPPAPSSTTTTTIVVDEPRRQHENRQLFDDLGSGVLAAFSASQQLTACAGLLRFLLIRLQRCCSTASSTLSSSFAAPVVVPTFAELLQREESSKLAAAAAASSGETDQSDVDQQPTAEATLINGEGDDDPFGFEDLDEEAHALLLPNLTASEVQPLLEAALAFVAAHLSRREILTAICPSASPTTTTTTTGGMTRLLAALVDALLWATASTSATGKSSASVSNRRHLASLCVRAIERTEAAVPGGQFLRVVRALLASTSSSGSDDGSYRGSAADPALVRRKALDLMLAKLTGLDRQTALPVLRKPLLDCLAGVAKHCEESQVALICGRELVRLLGASEPQPVLQFCLNVAASDYCFAEASPSDKQPNWEAFGCGLLACAEAVKQTGIAALPLVARLMPRLLPRLQLQEGGGGVLEEPTVHLRPPGVALLAAYAFLQQCAVGMCDLLVPYLPQLLPITVHYMLVGDASLRPKLRAVLAAVARGVHPAQLLPAMQTCLHSNNSSRLAPSTAEQWARLLRLSLHTTAAVEAADEEVDDDSSSEGDSRQHAESLADYEAELADLFGRLLSAVAFDGDASAATDHGGDEISNDSSSSDEEMQSGSSEGDAATERARSRLVAQLAACLTPLPPASRAMLLQSLQDWALGSSHREAALHRLLAAALPRLPSSLPALLCELDAPQHAAELLDPQAATAASPVLARWLLAFLAALFPVTTTGSAALSLDLLESLGTLLVDRLVAAAPRRPREVTRHLLPCLTAYAVAANGDEALLRPLTRRLCERGCRCPSDVAGASSSVRRCSLLALQCLLECLGDVFVDSLAADCVPALAELAEDAEDDTQEVERLAQRLLAEIERRAGEPLEI